jgi:hypothetical protein
MGNKYLKYMDDNNINDGVLRELLFKGKLKEAQSQLQETWKRYGDTITSIEEFSRIIKDDMEES